jgi:hypothetical protein
MPVHYKVSSKILELNRVLGHITYRIFICQYMYNIYVI